MLSLLVFLLSLPGLLIELLIELRHLPHCIGNLHPILISPLIMLKQLRLELLKGALSLPPIHYGPYLSGYLADLLLGAPTGLMRASEGGERARPVARRVRYTVLSRKFK